MNYLHDIGLTINNLFVGGPLRRLYHDGPTILGFWGGVDNSHICTTLSKAPIALWIANPEECLKLIERHFTGIYTLVNFIIYLIVFYNCMANLMFYYTISRPMGASINQMAKIMSNNKDRNK